MRTRLGADFPFGDEAAPVSFVFRDHALDDGGRVVLTFLRSARTFSRTAGFLLCGMVEEPIFPLKKGSSSSRISVRCRVNIS